MSRLIHADDSENRLFVTELEYRQESRTIWLVIETEYVGNARLIKTLTIHGAFLNPCAAKCERDRLMSEISAEPSYRRIEIRGVAVWQD